MTSLKRIWTPDQETELDQLTRNWRWERTDFGTMGGAGYASWTNGHNQIEICENRVYRSENGSAHHFGAFEVFLDWRGVGEWRFFDTPFKAVQAAIKAAEGLGLV